MKYNNNLSHSSSISSTYSLERFYLSRSAVYDYFCNPKSVSLDRRGCCQINQMFVVFELISSEGERFFPRYVSEISGPYFLLTTFWTFSLQELKHLAKQFFDPRYTDVRETESDLTSSFILMVHLLLGYSNFSTMTSSMHRYSFVIGVSTLSNIFPVLRAHFRQQLFVFSICCFCSSLISTTLWFSIFRATYSPPLLTCFSNLSPIHSNPLRIPDPVLYKQEATQQSKCSKELSKISIQ